MAGSTPPLPAELVADEVLFRALRSRDHLDDKRRAFLLRNDEKNSGLSVSYNCTSIECENRFQKTYGVLSIKALEVNAVKDVNGVSLRVVPDEPTHANIKGIPHEQDDAATAMRIAGELSALASTAREGKRFSPKPPK